MRDIVWTLLGFATACYVMLAALVTAIQRRLIYRPDPRRATPHQFALTGIETATMACPDGCTLAAWYAKARPGQRTVLYFHGNRGYIELRADRMADLQRRGLGVLMMSYRGYGGSTGFPSEDANVADARLAYDWLRQRGVAACDIVLFGESLGTGIATQVAGSKVSAGLILDSPYTSMADLAQLDYPWLPVRWLLFDHYETARHIKRVTVPVLVLHGESDALVPVWMGRAIQGAAVSPASLHTFEGASHLDHRSRGSFDVVERWIADLPGGARSSAAAQGAGAAQAEGAGPLRLRR